MNIFGTQKISGGWVFADQLYVDVPDPIPVMQGELMPRGVGVIRFAVDWQPATVETGVIAGYEISVNGSVFMRIGNELSYTFTWMAPATTHIVSVRAYTDQNVYSGVLSTTITTHPFPAAVRRNVLVNGRFAVEPGKIVQVAVFPRQ